MRGLLALVGVVALILVGAMALGFVRVNQTRDAKLPAVALVGGQSPKFNADVAHVTVGTEQKTVRVPTVEMKDQPIEVPKVKVDKPAAPADH